VIVTVLVAVSLAQPPVPITVYVMVVVPADTGVISPVVASIVATPVLADDHVPPDPVVVKVEDPLEQIACAPDSVPAFGCAVTVTVLVAVTSVHPPVPITV